MRNLSEKWFIIVFLAILVGLGIYLSQDRPVFATPINQNQPTAITEQGSATMTRAVLSDTPSPILDIIPINPPDKNLFVKNYIKMEAIKNGIDPEIALFVADKESRFDPSRTGDTDKICPTGINKGKIQRSRGLWQINDCFNPNVSDEVAFDIIKSTKWAMPRLRDNPKIWSVWKYRHEWFNEYRFNEVSKK